MSQNKKPIKGAGIPTLSLFSGAGGLDVGFLQAGFDIVACVEIEKTYSRTLEKNVGNSGGYSSSTQIHNIDIAKFDTSPYRNLGIRCVIGGPPCQTFSAAGRRSGGVIGTEDERGQLFLEYCRILDEIEPEIFVFENVYGLPGANGGEPWAEITKAFSERGYELNAEVVDAADYGVPQHRERLIMVGHKMGKFHFPMPTHGPDSNTKNSLVSVESALSDLQNADEPYHESLGGMYGHLLPLVPEGLNYAYFTAEMGHPEPVFAWRSKFHDLLYKVDRQSPCRTIKAQPGKFTGPFHWKNRHFNTQELKRLQTFPDDYELVGTHGKVLEQIGNSVPPRLAYVIAQSVREQLLEQSSEFVFDTRPVGFVSTFRQRQRERSKHFAETAKKAINLQFGETRPTPRKSNNSTQTGDSFFIRATGLHEREQISKAPLGSNHRIYSVNIQTSGAHIEMTVERIDGKPTNSSTVNISGLKKYLPDHDSLKLTASIVDLEDVFHCWGMIEKALTSRSRFFTLIDIYGHYANRGDTVRVESMWGISEEGPALKLLNHFTSTLHCGEFESSEEIRAKTDLDWPEFNEAVRRLREIRFDIRTRLTHPIIKGDLVLCTYPFPLLSPRAMVASKAQPIAARPKDISVSQFEGSHVFGS